MTLSVPPELELKLRDRAEAEGLSTEVAV